MRWDGVRWVEDDTLHVFDLARGICRTASAECGDSEKVIAVRLASKATSAAIERLAAADRRHGHCLATSLQCRLSDARQRPSGRGPRSLSCHQ